MIKNMVKELKFIKIKLNMLVYIIKIKKMGMENLLINLEILMKVKLLKTNLMVKELTSIRMEIVTMDTGSMAYHRVTVE